MSWPPIDRISLAAYTAQLEAGPTGWTLAQASVPESVSVAVEDEPWESWTLNEGRIAFTAAPADGAHVAVSYRRQADCD